MFFWSSNFSHNSYSRTSRLETTKKKVFQFFLRRPFQLLNSSKLYSFSILLINAFSKHFQEIMSKKMINYYWGWWLPHFWTLNWSKTLNCFFFLTMGVGGWGVFLTIDVKFWRCCCLHSISKSGACEQELEIWDLSNPRLGEVFFY